MQTVDERFTNSFDSPLNMRTKTVFPFCQTSQLLLHQRLFLQPILFLSHAVNIEIDHDQESPQTNFPDRTHRLNHSRLCIHSPHLPRAPLQCPILNL